MAEPTSAFTTYDLLLRVAELAGVAYYGASGNERAMIPINAHDLDKCVKCVNDGVKMFIDSAPQEGWRWKHRIADITFGIVETTGTVDSGTSTTLVDDALTSTYSTDNEINDYYVYDLTQEIYAKVTAYTASTGTVTVAAWLDYNDVTSSLTPAASDSYSITDVKTVHGSKARYWLPDDFGAIVGDITYAKDSYQGSGIAWVDEARIRQRNEDSESDGDPLMAAIRYFGVQRRSEIIFNPSPTSADTIEFEYERGFNKLQIEAGDSSAGDATSLTDDTLANLYPDDYFNGWYIYIISGTGKNSYAAVTDYTGSTGKFTVADWLAIDGSAGGTDPGASSVYYVTPAFTKPPCDMRFDTAVLSACKAQVELQFEDLQTTGYISQFYNIDLPKAYEIDRRSAPRTMGKMGRGRKHTATRNWLNIIVNGTQQ